MKKLSVQLLAETVTNKRKAKDLTRVFDSFISQKVLLSLL